MKKKNKTWKSALVRHFFLPILLSFPRFFYLPGDRKSYHGTENPYLKQGNPPTTKGRCEKNTRRQTKIATESTEVTEVERDTRKIPALTISSCDTIIEKTEE